jgi:hypothetical protein
MERDPVAKVAAAVGFIALAIVAAPVAGALLAGASLGTAAIVGAGAITGFGATLVGGAGIAAAISAWGTIAVGASIALSPSAKKVGQGAAGTQVNFQADPNSGIPFSLGRTGTAGKIIHANTTGQADKNSHLYYLIALSGGVISGVESLSCSGQLCTMDGDGNASGGNITGPSPYGGAMDIRWTYGFKPEPAYMQPPGFDPALAPEWTSDHLTSGVACAWWSLIYSSSAFPSGIPSPMFVVRGPPVYDPRQDSTVGGGSGPQRWDDESTWSYAGYDNPFLQGLTYCIGRRDNGKLTFGIGAPIQALDLEAFAEGAGVCESNAWTVGGEVLSTDTKWDALASILQAGGGEPIRLGGMISCVVRTPRVVVASLTGQDIVGDAAITGSKGRKDRFNQIIPSYRSEANGWQMVPGGAVTVDEYVTADGELRSKGGSYALVQDAKQAAQLAAYDIVDAREFEPVTLPVGPRFGALVPGDVISITEPEFGMSGQELMIETRQIDPTTGMVTLTCRSETPSKHAYALGQTPNPPPIPGLQPVDPTKVFDPDAGSWTAWGGILSGSDGSQIPAIVVTGHVNDPNVSNVLVDIRLELDATPTFGDWMTTTAPANATRIEIRAVIPGATYNVRVRYKTVRQVEGITGLDLGLVTVGTLISGGVTTIGGQTPEELVQQLNDTTALGQQTSDQANQTAQDLLPVSDSANYSKTRIDLIGSLLPNGSTFQMSDTTLFADASTTWGTYRTSLQSHVDNNTSAITTEQTARVNGDQANATSITNLSTTVNGNTASITTLQTSVNGLNAQYVLSVNAGGQVAGMKLAAGGSGGSSMAFIASQIGFSDGTSNVFPLAVVGGKVIATNFQADDIKANTITANMIIGGAVTATGITSAGAQSNPVGSEVTDMTFNYNSYGGDHLFDIYGELGTSTSSAAGTVFTLYCDGGAITSGAVYCPPNWGANGVSFPFAHRPGAGGHSYRLAHTGTTGSGPSQVNRTTVVLTELKK